MSGGRFVTPWLKVAIPIGRDAAKTSYCSRISDMCERWGRSIRQFEPVDRPSELVRLRLWEMLDFATYKNEILHRSNDLERLITRTQNEGMCARA